MAVMVIGSGPSPEMGKQKRTPRRIEEIGGDSDSEYEYESESEDGTASVQTEAAAMVADALGIKADNGRLAKALAKFYETCR